MNTPPTPGTDTPLPITADEVNVLDPTTYPNMDQLLAMAPAERVELLIRTQQASLDTDPEILDPIVSEFSAFGQRLVRATRETRPVKAAAKKKEEPKPAPTLAELMGGIAK